MPLQPIRLITFRCIVALSQRRMLCLLRSPHIQHEASPDAARLACSP